MGSSTYSEEFKKEAVRRLSVGGKSANDFSKELGVPQTTLSRWYRKASDRGEITSQDLVHGEELRRLRMEKRASAHGGRYPKKAVLDSSGFSEWRTSLGADGRRVSALWTTAGLSGRFRHRIVGLIGPTEVRGCGRISWPKASRSADTALLD